MTSTPSSFHPAQRSWSAYFLADRSRTFRASAALVMGLATVWSLGASGFGVLQSALALASILAAVCGLGLDPLVRERLKLRPLETAATLGTGMALRCGAGIIVYLILVMVTSPSQSTPRSVWLVSALLVLTQTPLLIGLRFEDPLHRSRAIFAHNLALALSFFVVLLLIWIGADPVWFAAAIVLEQPLAGLFLLFGHDQVAPDEETFHWEWSAATEWLRNCGKPLGTVLLTLALLPISQLLLIWRGTPAAAGYFGTAAVLFEFGAFCASVLILGRLARSHTTPDEAPILSESAIADDFNHAASIGWILALSVAAISALLAFTLFRKAGFNACLTGAFLGLSLIPLALGFVRDEYWRRAGSLDRATTARLIAVGVNLVLAFFLAPLAGAAGVAGSTLVALIVGELVMTLFPHNAPKLAQAQYSALLLRGLWPQQKAAPAASKSNSAEVTNTFMESLLPASLSDHHASVGTVSSAGAAVKSP